MAAEKVEFYRQEMAPLFPFVIVPSYHALTDMVADSPVMLMAIMVTTHQHDVDMQLHLATVLRNEICRRIFSDGEKNTDLLQGLLIFLSWYV